MSERKCNRKKVEPKHGGAKEQDAPVEEPVKEKVSEKSGSKE